MVDRDLVLRKLSDLARYIDQVSEYRHISAEEYREDWKSQRIIERTLQVAIEACVDVASHVIADRGLPVPATYAEVFDVLGQAGLIDPELRVAMVSETGCGSVMIGRGALGTPWVFDETFDTLSSDGQRNYKGRVIARHCELIRQHFREKYALIQMKKHLAWYTEGLGHATRCRAEIFQSRDADEVWNVFQTYWEKSP